MSDEEYRRSSAKDYSSDEEESTGPSAGVVVGVAAIAVAAAAVGVKMLLKKTSSPAPKQPTQRKKVPPRRPRSTTSSKQPSPISSTAATPTKAGVPLTPGSGPSLPKRPVPRMSPVPEASKLQSVGAAAAGVAAATAATATAVAAAVSKPEEPVVENKTPAAALEAAGNAAVHHVEDAVQAKDTKALLEATEELEDVVDDQIQNTKEEAVEALVGTVGAAAEAEEAIADAEAALAKAAPKEEKEEEAPKKPSAAPKLPAQKKQQPAKKPAAPKPEPAKPPAANGAAAAPPKPAAEKPAPKAAAQEEQVPEPNADNIEINVQPMDDEADADMEYITDYTIPALNFEGCPKEEDDPTDVEKQIRDNSLHAVKIAREQGKIVQASKEMQAVLDLSMAPESAGKVRPTLVAGAAFTLSDLLVSQKQIEKAKECLSIGYAASQFIEDKGAAIRALTSYGYIIRNEKKPRSAYRVYEEAVAIAKEAHGKVHPRIEQVEMELAAHMSKVGRTEDAGDYLVTSAHELLAESDRLEKDESGNSDDKKTEEDAQENDETAQLPLYKQARHFAFRKLLNAAGILDAVKRHEDAEKALLKAVEAASSVHGESSIPVMNTLYALGQHYKGTGDLQKALEKHEAALNMMDENIEVYEPDMLQNRVALLRDLALLCDAVELYDVAAQYAEGAAVNAQLLAGVLTQSGAPKAQFGSMLESFYNLLADMRTKAGDEEGAAEARRNALRNRMQTGMAVRGGGRQGLAAPQRSSSSRRKTGTGQASARAGGRRV